jgi:hypothetical protein
LIEINKQIADDIDKAFEAAKLIDALEEEALKTITTRYADLPELSAAPA